MPRWKKTTSVPERLKIKIMLSVFGTIVAVFAVASEPASWPLAVIALALILFVTWLW